MSVSHSPTSCDALVLDDVTVSYRHRPAVDSISAHVPRGVLSALVGPNGAGKSTVLKACLGLVPVDSGSLSLLGQPVRRARRDIAYVPQSGSVDWDFPIRVAEVVAMGCSARSGWFRRPGPAGRSTVAACLERVGLSDLANRPIGQLSGGQRQRTFLARALAQDAELLLLDEPFAAVDAPTEELLLGLLEDLCAAGRSVIVVHHDLGTVRERFGWAVLLGSGTVAAGLPEAVLAPERLLAAYGGTIRTTGSTRRHDEAARREGLAWAS